MLSIEEIVTESAYQVVVQNSLDIDYIITLAKVDTYKLNQLIETSSEMLEFSEKQTIQAKIHIFGFILNFYQTSEQICTFSDHPQQSVDDCVLDEYQAFILQFKYQYKDIKVLEKQQKKHQQSSTKQTNQDYDQMLEQFDIFNFSENSYQQ